MRRAEPRRAEPRRAEPRLFRRFQLTGVLVNRLLPQKVVNR